MKVIELLADESKWVQRAFARTINNTPVVSTSDEAVCWCLEGAINKCYPPNERNAILTKLENNIKDYCGHKRTVQGFNDDKNTKFEDVLKVATKADI